MACYNQEQKELYLAMEKQKHTIRINIGYFLNQANGYFRDFHVEFPEIFIEPDLNVIELK